jgi:hypothetical protein
VATLGRLGSKIQPFVDERNDTGKRTQTTTIDPLISTIRLIPSTRELSNAEMKCE